MASVLRRAVLALIDKYLGELGEGEFSNFILMSQATTRLPIQAEVLTVDGRMTHTIPEAGKVRLSGSIQFLHRGIKLYNTSDYDEASRTFDTEASKIYHLRWNPADGFSLNDLADDETYNPGSLDENDATFDSTYDDMLVARIVTNSSNVATVTHLSNKHQLTGFKAGSVNFGVLPPGGHASAVQEPVQTVNFARTPRYIAVPLGTRAPEAAIAGGVDVGFGPPVTAPGTTLERDRYGFQIGVQAANTTNTSKTVTAYYEVHWEA